jgi:hypothetical protein
VDGVYLYCVRNKTVGPSAFRKEGIEKRKGVYAVVRGELEAVVSRVALSGFTSEEVQKRAREDLGWIREKALIHERVIEEAMRGADGLVDVIPMRFGIIFKNEAGLQETLDRNHGKMSGLLRRIQGKQEWNVKAYLVDEERFELTVRESNEEIGSKEKEAASMPEGAAYFMEEELEEIVRGEAARALDTALESLFIKLGEKAAESVKTRVLGREMTGKAERMVFNAAFLLRTDRLGAFKKAVNGAAGELHPKGFRLEYSGPWPPFNFSGHCGLSEKA